MSEPTSTSERNEIQIAVMTEKVTNIEKNVGDIKGSLHELMTQIDGRYATKAEVAPVKAIVYGLVTLILTAVIGAMLYLVINH